MSPAELASRRCNHVLGVIGIAGLSIVGVSLWLVHRYGDLDAEGTICTTAGVIALLVALAALLLTVAVLLLVRARWRCRCPQCDAGRAHFMTEERQEFLVCESCLYREPTGVWSD